MERRRTAPRRALLLACAAAVPALLLAGCSSGGSDSGSGSGSGSGSSSAGKSTTAGTNGKSTGATSTSAGQSATRTPAPGKFATLPDACTSVGKATVTALVPKAKSAAGTPTDADAADHTRSGCSWTGNGADGYQYRWLAVTLQRFDATPTSSAEDQAKERFAGQVATLGKTPGAATTAVTGVGDQATTVAAKATVVKVTSQNATLLARTGNVVVIVEYNGAGLEGKKNPTAADVDSGALRAAKDAVAAIAAANA
ncbi:DUF3558 domain-containing protein [Actinacidiphila epipremni]|uniref:DUF3558 domain-containing protein n=1 Tax=Actinacidiphila epipremni TaxID=2053013 RepID=A0ABX0ZVX4_9ACTN|nr:DUF3558 domain-containing protein [Actinacidiphila epipremni]NJP48199.1 DUF3558 domain-containing protein [Actinacidiphila epipremni]